MADALIYTKYGNLPIADLIFETLWDNQLTVKLLPTFENGQLKFGAQLQGSMVAKPTYYLKNPDGSKGELVKQDVLVYHTGIEAAAEQGQLT